MVSAVVVSTKYRWHKGGQRSSLPGWGRAGELDRELCSGLWRRNKRFLGGIGEEGQSRLRGARECFAQGTASRLVWRDMGLRWNEWESVHLHVYLLLSSEGPGPLVPPLFSFLFQRLRPRNLWRSHLVVFNCTGFIYSFGKHLLNSHCVGSTILGWCVAPLKGIVLQRYLSKGLFVAYLSGGLRNSRSYQSPKYLLPSCFCLWHYLLNICLFY